MTAQQNISVGPDFQNIYDNASAALKTRLGLMIHANELGQCLVFYAYGMTDSYGMTVRHKPSSITWRPDGFKGRTGPYVEYNIFPHKENAEEFDQIPLSDVEELLNGATSDAAKSFVNFILPSIQDLYALHAKVLPQIPEQIAQVLWQFHEAFKPLSLIPFAETKDSSNIRDYAYDLVFKSSDSPYRQGHEKRFKASAIMLRIAYSLGKVRRLPKGHETTICSLRDDVLPIFRFQTRER